MITLLNKFDDKYTIKEKDVLDIVWAYAKENNLEDYLKDVVFDPECHHVGNYNNNIITFNEDKINNLLVNIYNKLVNSYTIYEDNYTYFLNFIYLFITFHEAEHISEKALYESNRGSEIFNYLYEKCIKITDKDYSFYKANHDLFPSVIQANNQGYLHAYNLMTHTKLGKRDQRIMHLEYLKSLLHNYQKAGNKHIITPIDKLAMLTDEIDINVVNKLVNQSKLSKMERLNMGLIITPSEYDSIVRERVIERQKVKISK